MSRARIGRPKLRVIGLPSVRSIVKGTKTDPKKLTTDDVRYFRDLHRIIDEVYTEAEKKKWTWSQLALRAGLASTTVSRLGLRETRWPAFRTVYLLCRAVGWELAPARRARKSNVAV